MKKLQILLVLFIVNSFYLHADSFRVNGVRYYTVGDNVEVTNCYPELYSGDIIIPSSVSYNGKNYSVIGIAQGAFSGSKDLTSISIPESVTRIGHYAFLGCSGLKKITLSKFLRTLGQAAFGDCSNLELVEWNAIDCKLSKKTLDIRPPFEDCVNLKTLIFGNEVKYIPEHTCYNLSSLTSVTIPESVLGIGKQAFYGCAGLKSVIIPESMKGISEEAFSL